MKTIKRLLTALFCVIGVSAVLLAAAFFVLNSQLDKIDKIEDGTFEMILPDDEFFDTDLEIDDLIGENDETAANDGADSVTEISPEDVTFDTAPEIDSGDLINILLVGQDRRDGEGRQRSDSMILCSINVSTGDVSLISFLRDMYVSIPGGYSDNRLNVTYLFGGFPLLNETLMANFGISADHNIEVDFDGFVGIIDAIGGVKITLTKKEAEVIGGGAVKGENLLFGDDALTYSRIRKLDSDFGRTERQRKVLLAIFEKIKMLPASEIFSLVTEISELITTDMSNGEIMSLAMKLAPKMSDIKISQHTVPEAGMYYDAVIRKMMVLVPDTAKIRRAIAEEYLPVG